MRTREPRIQPVRDDELDAGQEAFIAPFRATGDNAITRTMLRHLEALKAVNKMAVHLLVSPDCTLSPRDRELLILRTAWRCRSGYEWARHVLIGRRAGVSEAELAALKQPVDAGNWSERDAALVATADSLVTDHFVPDEVWAVLRRHFDDKQCIDAIYAVGFYGMIGMFLNTAGVELDADVTLDPDFDFRP